MKVESHTEITRAIRENQYRNHKSYTRESIQNNEEKTKKKTWLITEDILVPTRLTLAGSADLANLLLLLMLQLLLLNRLGSSSP